MEKLPHTKADDEATRKSEQADWGMIDRKLPMTEVNASAVEILTSPDYLNQISSGTGEIATARTVSLVDVGSEPAQPNPMDVVTNKK